MTAKHYASADSVANVRLTRASEALAPTDRIGSLLAQLTPDELSELRQRMVPQ